MVSDLQLGDTFQGDENSKFEVIIELDNNFEANRQICRAISLKICRAISLKNEKGEGPKLNENNLIMYHLKGGLPNKIHFVFFFFLAEILEGMGGGVREG